MENKLRIMSYLLLDCVLFSDNSEINIFFLIAFPHILNYLLRVDFQK